MTQIRSALDDFRASASVHHAGTKGRAREIAVSRLFQPFVPEWVRLTSGHLADSYNGQTGQLDVIMHDPRLLAPVMFDPACSIVPIEASLAVIEVKSRLDATGVREALSHANSVRGLSFNYREPRAVFSTLFALFAFSSDLEGNAKTELDRYLEADADGEMNPAIGSICVPGRGFWRFEHGRGWMFCPPTEELDDVVDFAGVLINELADVSNSRGRPRLGNYVMHDRDIQLVRPIDTSPRP